jgi:thioredoxin 1
MVLNVDKDNYDAEVIKASADQPVMVDFWGPQCKPCLALMPSVDKLQERYVDKIKITKLNPAEGNRMLCAKLRVMGLPTLLFYKKGVEIKRLTGEQITERDIEEAIKSVIA